MSDDILNQPPFTCGTLIANQYLLQQVLGHGGLGRTYLALDVKRFNEPCVLKEFSPRVKGERILQKSRTLFKREAEILYRLEHPQIPKFFATFESDGRLFLVQEFIDGRTYLSLLQARRKQRYFFSESEVIDWLNKLLPVLDYIHQRGIIHRDISPDNIMLPAGSELPMLIDFGVGKQVVEALPQEPDGPHNPAYVSRLSIVGKLGYSPPEQIRQGICTPSSDLYALGVVALVLLTGKEPSTLINQHTLQWEWRPFAQVSSGFSHILDKLIAAEPRHRYQSASEVMVALKAIERPQRQRTEEQRTKGPRTEEQRTEASGSSAGELYSPPDHESHREVTRPAAVKQSQLKRAAVSVDDANLEAVTPQSLQPRSSLADQKFFRRPGQPVLAVGIALAIMIVTGTIARYFVLPQDSTAPSVESVKPQLKPAPFLEDSTLSGHEDTVWSVIFSADDNRLISSSEDKTIKIWDLRERTVEKTLSNHEVAVRTIQQSVDGTTLISGSAGGMLMFWRLPMGEYIRSLQAHDSTIWAIAIHPNGQQFATASSDQTVKIWQMETGNLIHTLRGHTDWVFGLTYSPDGSRLVSSDRGGHIKLWDPATAQEISSHIPKQGNAVRALAFEPQGKYLASAGWDGTVKLWEIATGTNHHTFSGHTDRVVSVAFSPVDNLMISSSIDRTIKVWDWKNLTLLDSLSGHGDWVLSTDVSLSGQILVSGGKDRRIKVWQRGQ